jgi:hypothetical protein
MTVRAVLRRALIGIYLGHLNNVLLGALTMHVLQMTMIEVIDVITMPNGYMATAWAMDM